MTSDIVDSSTRSRMMKAVRQRGTRPEMEVRRLLRDLGIHYRVSNKGLPGTPDLANRSRRWAIFVHGCFWHGHRNCAKTKGGQNGRVPKQNRAYWEEKIRNNRERDARKERELTSLGFRVLVVWECELRERPKLVSRLRDFFCSPSRAEANER